MENFHKLFESDGTTTFNPKGNDCELYKIAFTDDGIEDFVGEKLSEDYKDDVQNVAIALLEGLKNINPKTIEKLAIKVQDLIVSGEPENIDKAELAWTKLFEKVASNPKFQKLEETGIDVDEILELMGITSSFGSESLKERINCWNMFLHAFGLELQNEPTDRTFASLQHQLKGAEQDAEQDELTESNHMNRELLKKAIKKLVIQEITNNQFGTPIHTDKKDKTAEEALAKAMGKDADVRQIHGAGKTAGQTDKQTVSLSKNADDNYDVVSVTNEGERKISRGVSLEAAVELIKQHAKDSDKTPMQKSYDKGKAPLKKEENKDKQEISSKEDETDKMEETDEKTQLDIADKETQKADVKSTKENAPTSKEDANVLGGDIVDKIEKIVDRVLKDKTKADAKGAYLKHDKDTESPDKLITKLKDTPALKEKKQ